MIFTLKPNIQRSEVAQLMSQLKWMNLEGILVEGNGQFSIAVVRGEYSQIDFNKFLSLPQIVKIQSFTQKFKLASRELKQRSIIKINDYEIGGGNLTVIAGPCSIESEEQMNLIAGLLAKAGANILRGGAFKPRSSPYDFQGLGETGLKYLKKYSAYHNLITVTEVMDSQDVDLVAAYTDILQIGARNMQNYSLLKCVGKIKKPVLLKRGLSASYTDLLMSAEYILQAGNPDVILCERGIRTFETYTRNTLDLAAIPVLHELSHLPVIIDPSHGIGIRKLVPAMAYAAVAAGADGIMVEVHPEPDKSYSDAKQTISPDIFNEMMNKIKLIRAAINND